MGETQEIPPAHQASETSSHGQIFVSENNAKTDNLLVNLRPGKFTAILSVLLIIVGVPIALHVLSQPTDIPIKASSGTTLSITGNQEYVVGQKVNLNVILDPGDKAISSAKIVIKYNSSILQRDSHGIVPNQNGFPDIVQRPIYDQCTNNICTMSVTLSIGSNPTQAITQTKQIATINFTALQITNNVGTSVSFDELNTQVYSFSSNTSPNQSVLATLMPLNININKTFPTSSEVLTPSQSPTQSTNLKPSPTPPV